MRDILICFTSDPYASPIAQERIDLLIAALNFDRDAALLLLNDSALALAPDQRPIFAKSAAAKLQLLELFDLEDIYVCSNQLPDNSVIAVKEVPEGTLNELMNSFKNVWVL
ncbi:DsrE family protein [uncultured Umboniibacter sp.]|uniref:DsrE family protein n=1 Tax=uncultured Umboniibacter sp. TaxID=1798917 RepID=UPI002612180B|nr:DsrE family protein [uncultured Umboniibacter sp.]